MDAAETGTSGDIFIPIQKAWKRYDDSLTELQYASLKSIQTGLLEASPESNCRNTFRIYRQTMAKYGSKRFHEGLKASGILNDDGTTIGTESQRTGSLNIFASIASEAICQDTMIEANKSLGDAGTEFVIACNRPLYDEHWEDADEDWLGKASMSKLHKFVLVRDMHWTWFNLLAVGLCSDEGAKAVDKDRLEAQIETMKRLRETAFKFAKKDGWSDDVKLFVHVYPHNSVMALHVHLLDMSCTGPSFDAQKHKNLEFDDALAVFEDELEELTNPAKIGGCCRESAVTNSYAYVHQPNAPNVANPLAK